VAFLGELAKNNILTNFCNVKNGFLLDETVSPSQPRRKHKKRRSAIFFNVLFAAGREIQILAADFPPF
jgi:hypothetical protein